MRKLVGALVAGLVWASGVTAPAAAQSWYGFGSPGYGGWPYWSTVWYGYPWWSPWSAWYPGYGWSYPGYGGSYWDYWPVRPPPSSGRVCILIYPPPPGCE
jgi:hypothetical protein